MQRRLQVDQAKVFWIEYSENALVHEAQTEGGSSCRHIRLSNDSRHGGHDATVADDQVEAIASSVVSAEAVMLVVEEVMAVADNAMVVYWPER